MGKESTLSDYLTEIPIKCWKDILEKFDEHFSNLNETGEKRWIFRGDKQNSLNPHVIKAFDNFDFQIKKDMTRQDFEEWLIRKFQRHAHHYLKSSEIPKSDDFGQWLSIMSHYGAPTRLLDWTYSFFNALFFAVNRIELEKDESKPKCCYVWAIDDVWLDKIAKKHIKNQDKELKWYIERKEFDLKNPEIFKKSFFRENEKYCEKKPNPITFVHGYNPLRLNNRLIAQKGFFLCQGDVSKSFNENLINTIQCDKERAKKSIFRYKIDCNIDERKKMLYKLYRLGISSEILFPDLEGFAESHLHYFAYPDVLKPNI